MFGAAFQKLLSTELTEARARWPGIEIDDAPVAERWGRAVAGAAQPLARLRELAFEDLYLAAALGAGHPRAIEAFEGMLGAPLTSALRRLDPCAAFADEVRQRVRERVLVGAQLDDFQGTGPLVRWLRAVAISAGLEMLRERKREVPLDDETLWDEPVGASDPELDYVKDRYRQDFREAFRQALAQVPARDRTVLRLNLLAGLNIEEIGRVYRVHRSSVARWIATAREAVITGTRRNLAARLRVSRPELDSLLRRVRSDMDLSLRAWLVASADGR